MKETKFPALMLNSYVIEIFGSGEHKNPLIMKNLSQKTKFHLKKLGEQFHKEDKALKDQVMDIRKELSDEVEEDGKKFYQLKEENKDEFKKRISELEAIVIPLLHYEFTEADFIDKKTGDVVGGEDIYYNIIDILIYSIEEPELVKTP